MLQWAARLEPAHAAGAAAATLTTISAAVVKVLSYASVIQDAKVSLHASSMPHLIRTNAASRCSNRGSCCAASAWLVHFGVPAMTSLPSNESAFAAGNAGCSMQQLSWALPTCHLIQIHGCGCSRKHSCNSLCDQAVQSKPRVGQSCIAPLVGSTAPGRSWLRRGPVARSAAGSTQQNKTLSSGLAKAINAVCAALVGQQCPQLRSEASLGCIATSSMTL